MIRASSCHSKFLCLYKYSNIQIHNFYKPLDFLRVQSYYIYMIYLMIPALKRLKNGGLYR
jgi:hypothetical protein